MANQIILGRALDLNGYVIAGAKATVFATGTSTPVPVFSDPAGAIPAANPIIADGNGFWPQRFVDVTAKVVVTDADDVTLYTLDPAPTTLGVGAAAAAVSFSPTVDIPETNVQDAIERVNANVLGGVTAFGLGIVGNAPLLSSLDATTTASGTYRFAGTTTGTYPPGVAAADTGVVEYWRQTAGIAFQTLYQSTTNRVFQRRMVASVWQPWVETLNINSLVGNRYRELTPIDNPAGTSGVGFDFDFPAPPAGEPAYDPLAIFPVAIRTGPTATARMLIQLKVDGVRVPEGYVSTSFPEGFTLFSLNAGTFGTGYFAIRRVPGRPFQWTFDPGISSETTGSINLDTPWTTRSYPVGAIVNQGGTLYRCISAHVASNFAADLAFPRWVVTTGVVTGIGMFQRNTTFSGSGTLACAFRG